MPNIVVGSIVTIMPTLVIILWNVVAVHNGRPWKLLGYHLDETGTFSIPEKGEGHVATRFIMPDFKDPVVWGYLLAFMAFQMLL